MTDDAPGPWELGRQLQSILETVGRIEDRMVPRPEFELFKAEVDRRFGTADDRLTQVASEKASAHGKIEGRVEELRRELNNDRADRAAWSREVNSRVWVGVGLGVLAVVGAALSRALGF